MGDVSSNTGESKRRILEAATVEFSRFGQAGARVQRIAQRAGVNKQLVFYYFGSKQRLYAAVIEQAALRVIPNPRLVEADLPPPERLRRLLSRAVDAMTAHPDLLRLLLHDARNTEPETASAVRAALVALVAPIRDAVSEGQGLGYFRDEVEPNRTALQAVALAVGYFGIEAGLRDHDLPDLPDWKESLIELILNSLNW